MSELCRALNILFWKLPSVIGNTKEDGQWWVAELRDKGIIIEWDKEKEEFKEEINGKDKVHEG